jgi:hypothetical protein
MSARIILLNWTRGGTGLTNFQKEELPIYEAAVARFGNPDYVICSKALGNEYFSSKELSDRCHSLHHLGGGDSCPFWRVFEDVYSEMRPTYHQTPK